MLRFVLSTLVLAGLLAVDGNSALAGHGRCCGYYVAPTYAVPTYATPTYSYAAPAYAAPTFSYAAPTTPPQIFIVPQSAAPNASAADLAGLGGLLGGKGGRILRCVLNESIGSDSGLDFGDNASDSSRLKRIEDKLDLLLGKGGSSGGGMGGFADPFSANPVVASAANQAAVNVQKAILKSQLEQQKAALQAQIDNLK